MSDLPESILKPTSTYTIVETENGFVILELFWTSPLFESYKDAEKFLENIKKDFNK